MLDLTWDEFFVLRGALGRLQWEKEKSSDRELRHEAECAQGLLEQVDHRWRNGIVD